MRMLLVSVLAGLVLAPTAGAVMRFPAVTQLASEVAGRPVDIYCEAPAEWAIDGEGFDAYTWFDHGHPTYIALGPRVCGGVVLTIADPAETKIAGYSDRRGLGLLALAHESMHVRYAERNEALTECRALKTLPDVAARLGLNVPRIMVAALAYDATLPPAYHGASC